MTNPCESYGLGVRENVISPYIIRLLEIQAFERWQNEPDEDYTFSAIRVAVLLIRYREEQNAKLHREEIN